MARRIRALILAAMLGLLALAVLVPAAYAHPMGNFSINHFAKIEVGKGQIRILYLVDMAEIPTFQELSGIGADPAGKLTLAQRSSYLPGKIRDLRNGLQLTVGGRPVALRTRASDVLFPPGAGGLPTERLYALFEASIPAGRVSIAYHDGNFAGRAGWKEIVLATTRGTEVSSATTTVDRSKALTVYPSSITASPPQDLDAHLQVEASGLALTGDPEKMIKQAEAPLLTSRGGWSALAQGLTRVGSYATGSSGGSSWSAGRIDALTNLIKHGQLSVGLLLVSLVIAFWFGAAHALSPGHGKTVVAAYLVGNRGTAWHAVLLGLTVTVTHTSGVFALGLVTLYLSHYVVPDQLYPWLGFASGLMVAAMGLGLFVRRLGVARAGAGAMHGVESQAASHVHRHGLFGKAHSHVPDHAQSPSAGDHHHDHGHSHGPLGKPHSHTHRDPLSVKSLLALGVSGGLLPCPSALVVLLSAIAFHRLAFGMLLIVAFSLGLATTLTSVGMVMVFGRRLISRLPFGRVQRPALGRAVRMLPAFSALVVAALGTIIAVGAIGPSIPVAL